MRQFFLEIQPALITLFGAIVTAAIIYLTNLVRQKTGIDIEKKYQDDLHSAIMSGVKAALEKWGPNVTVERAVEASVLHAENSVPDAMKALNPSPEVLARIAAAKLVDAKALAEVPARR
jgi:ABC-type uncharacterized transport system substrate-binding protein